MLSGVREGPETNVLTVILPRVRSVCETERQAGRQTGRHTAGEAGRQAEPEAGHHAGRQAEPEAGHHAGRGTGIGRGTWTDVRQISTEGCSWIAGTSYGPPEWPQALASRLSRCRERRRPLLTGLSRTSRPRSSRDRKSTRLNSSHVAISYAVFCLKNQRRGQEG